MREAASSPVVHATDPDPETDRADRGLSPASGSPRGKRKRDPLNDSAAGQAGANKKGWAGGRKGPGERKERGSAGGVVNRIRKSDRALISKMSCKR